MPSVIYGIAGVTLLLTAFGLNLIGRLSEQGTTYLIMNIFGAFLAAWYAWSGGQMPFVVLETVWGGVALARLIRNLTQKSSQP